MKQKLSTILNISLDMAEEECQTLEKLPKLSIQNWKQMTART
jgi:hypothetical protein